MAKNINPALFVLAQNASMVLNKATVNEMKILGLQGLGLGLGFSQDEKTIPMMGVRIAPTVFTGAKYESMTVNNNFIEGDPTQEALRNAALGGVMLKAIRNYTKDGCHFSAPDQPNSTGVAHQGGYTTGMSGMNVGSYTDPKASAPTDTFTNSVTFAPGGPFSMFIAHTVPGTHDNIKVTSETTTGGGATIELLDGTTWDSRGFEDGDTIIVDYNGDHPKYGVIESGSNTDTIVLIKGGGDGALMADGTLTAGGQVHGASPSIPAEMETTC